MKSLLIIIASLALFSCGINDIPTKDEKVKAAWGQVENQYQRRADLVPNLVEVVKGAAEHENETLVAVTEARAKVGSIQAGNLLDDPQRLQQFEQAQSQLTSALSRLMVVVEKYPVLQANQNFLTLSSQLEGTENRIAVARKDYIDAVADFNTEIRTFPGLIWYKVLYSDLKMRETYEATKPNVEQAPEVKF